MDDPPDIKSGRFFPKAAAVVSIGQGRV